MKKDDMLGFMAIIIFFLIILCVGFAAPKVELEEEKTDIEEIIEYKEEEEVEEEILEEKTYEEETVNQNESSINLEGRVETHTIVNMTKVVLNTSFNDDIPEEKITDDNGYLLEKYDIEELKGKKVKTIYEPLYTETGLGQLDILTEDGKLYALYGECRMKLLQDEKTSDDCVKLISTRYSIDSIAEYRVYDYANWLHYSEGIYYSNGVAYNFDNERVDTNKLMLIGGQIDGFKAYSDGSVTYDGKILKDKETKKEIKADYIIFLSPSDGNVYFLNNDKLYKVELTTGLEYLDDYVIVKNYKENNDLVVTLGNGRKIIFEGSY